MDADYLFKIVVVGDSGVGKTNILNRFSRDSFEHNSKNTIGVDFSALDLQLNGKHVKVQFWDTAGQEKYRAIASAYYKNSHGAVIVYDITNRPSFEHMSEWLKELREHGESDMNLLIVGNKNDLLEARQIAVDDGRSFAQSLGVKFVELSAKDNKENEIQRALNGFVEQIVARIDANNASSGDKMKSRIPTTIDQVASSQQKPKGCC